MFNLATAQDKTSTNSSFCGGWAGESPASTLRTSNSTELDEPIVMHSLGVEEAAERASGSLRALDPEAEG